MIECAPELQRLKNALEKLADTPLNDVQKQAVLQMRQGVQSLIDEEYSESTRQFSEAQLTLIG